MAMHLDHHYYVVEIKFGRYDGHHVIVPKSWILLYDREDGVAALKYPSGPLPGLRQWVEDKRSHLKEWGDFPGYVKFECDSYEEAEEYIESLITDVEEEPETKKIKMEETPTAKDSEKFNVEIELKQLQIVLPRLEISQLQSNIKNDKTSLNQKEMLDNADSMIPQEFMNLDADDKQASKPSNMIDVILSDEYLKSLNKCHSENEDISNTLAEIKKVYDTKCSVIKKAIEWITTFKERHKKFNKIAENARLDITSASNTQEQQNISKAIDNLCEITAAVINGTKENEDLLQLSKSVSRNTSTELKKIQQHENDYEISNKEIDERENIPACETIDSKDDIINNNLKMPSNQIKETKNYDTKWTLNHPKMKEGLVELIKGQGVYVTEESLSIHQFYNKCSKLVCRLLNDVFSKDALLKCAFSKEAFENKLVLDKHALDVLIEYVKQLKIKKCWPGLNVKGSVKLQLRQIQKKHQQHIKRRHKKKVVNYSKAENNSSPTEEIRKVQKMLAVIAANDTAQFFLQNK